MLEVSERAFPCESMIEICVVESFSMLKSGAHLCAREAIGSPAVTRRGFKEAECKMMTDWICDVLDDIENEAVIASVQEKVLALCAKFPVYPKS